MSKSKGNVIDPLGVIDLHGTDALRMALVFANSPGQDIAFSEDKIIAQRRFANKIWNAARFVLTQEGQNGHNPAFAKPSTGKQNPKTKADKEILEKLQKTIKSTTKDIENFQFHEAAQTLYHFFWHTFCDQYIEQAKIQISKPTPQCRPEIAAATEGSKTPNENTINILLYVLRESLKLLHPFMPFITEQIYQMLPNKEKETLIIENWPK